MMPRFIVRAAAGRITVSNWLGFWAYPLVYKKQTGTSPSWKTVKQRTKRAMASIANCNKLPEGIVFISGIIHQTYRGYSPLFHFPAFCSLRKRGLPHLTNDPPAKMHRDWLQLGGGLQYETGAAFKTRPILDDPCIDICYPLVI